ncbi:MAG: radical SAM protein [Verrucomicrobiota bacterium]|nr:radical SAM protein [Verrucomicrobiota bacterium]
MIRFTQTRHTPQLDPEIERSAAWVDDYFARVSPYIFVRVEDNLLIKRPNQAQKLNTTGATILKALLDRTPAASILQLLHDDVARQRQVCAFLWAVRQWIDGDLNELNAPSDTVEIRPLPLQFSKLPVLAEIALTYRCNLRCRFCYAGCNCTANPTGDSTEMTTPQVRKVLTRIFREGEVPSISFTGGEPTLRPDLPSLIQFAKQLGMRVNLITNGTQIDRGMADTLANAGLDSAQVSLEGVTAEVHDGITQVPGSFAASLAGVRALAAAGIRVHTNTTLNRLNRHEAERFPAFLKQTLQRERFSMNMVIPAGSATQDAALVIRYSEIGTILEQVQQASREADVEFMWYSPTPVCMFNPIIKGLGNKGCSACDGLISVGANGDVLPCSSYNDPVGNLLTQTLKTVWFSQRARNYRAKAEAPAICQTCEHLNVCHGACPLYWRAMGCSELEAGSQ